MEKGVQILMAKQTMTSIEIAELTGKQHAHVMRDIRNILKQGVQESNFGLSSYQQSIPNGGFKTVPQYVLTKKGCLILASGYDALLREKIINRWEELEIKYRSSDFGGFYVPQTHSEALMLAAKQAREIERQNKEIKLLEASNKEKEEQIEEQRPKVLFSDAIVGSKSSCLVSELAKLLTQNGYKIGQNRLFKWFREHGYFGSHGERYNIPNQQYVEMGLFDLKKSVHSENGVLKTSVTPKVTGKGQQYFINKFLGKCS